MQGIATLLIYSFLQSSSATTFTLVDQPLFNTPNANTVAWADYDSDGDLDVAVAFDSGRVSLYENTNGLFEDIGQSLGFPQTGSPARGLSWGDYDDDGDPDLYVSYVSWFSYESNKLFRNDREQVRFVDVTEAVGLDFTPVFSRQANWIDYDGDGDLDLFSAQRQGNNRLFENIGGSFKDVSVKSGLYDPRRTVGACWFDMDQDGDLDLFNANQQADRDAMYQNNDGVFTDVAIELGMAHTERPTWEGGVACSVTDFDNDGNLDLFVGTYGPDHLYKGDGRGGFTDVAQNVGIVGNTHVVGSHWGDFDHDGRVDLYLTAYEKGQEHGGDRLLKNTIDGFVSVLPENIESKDGDHGVVWLDYDEDGDLDLNLTSNGITMAKGGYASNPDYGNHFIFRNNMPQNKGRSLKVLVLNKKGHLTHYGAEIRLFESGTSQILGTQIIETGGGYNTQNAIPVHFGLKEPTTVDVEVTFLKNGQRHKQKHTNISTHEFTTKPLIIQEK